MNELAIKLIKIELQLNEENEHELGSLMAENWREIFENQYSQQKIKSYFLLDLFVIFKQSTTFLFSKKKHICKISDNVLIAKSGERQHLNMLMNFIFENNSPVFLFKGDYNNLLVDQDFWLKFKIIIKTVNIFFKNNRIIKRKLVELSVSKFNLNNQLLFLNTLHFNACFLFFNKYSFMKIVVDFDRGKFAPLILAAKKLKIATISLQHGAINPPYGFVPLVADEIWVWGKLWKNELIDMGVKEDSIKIVGSTIVDEYRKPKLIEGIKIIGIGPNPIGIENNEFIWKKLSEQLLDQGYKIVIKLHPSMAKGKYINCFDPRCEIYEDKDLENIYFFEMADLLIVSSSSLGYESILMGTPVAVIRESIFSNGNDAIMVDKCGFIELKVDYKALIEALNFIENNYIGYVMTQQKIIKSEIFAFTGKDAKTNILNNLNNVGRT